MAPLRASQPKVTGLNAICSGSKVALDSKLGDVAASAGNIKHITCLLKGSSFTLVMRECGLHTRVRGLDQPIIERIQAQRTEQGLPQLAPHQLEVGDVMGNIFDEAMLATAFHSIEPCVLGNIVIVRKKVPPPATIQMHIHVAGGAADADGEATGEEADQVDAPGKGPIAAAVAEEQVNASGEEPVAVRRSGRVTRQPERVFSWIDGCGAKKRKLLPRDKDPFEDGTRHMQ